MENDGKIKYYGAPDGTIYYFDENGEIVESDIKLMKKRDGKPPRFLFLKQDVTNSDTHSWARIHLFTN
jgi:hypothetical protein